MPLVAIIEDELIIAQDIKEILENEGHTCIINIDTYSKAIKVIEEQKPDLVIIDIMLRSSDNEGIKIGQFLHQKQSIPFIFLTSLHDKETISEIKKTFPFGYIVKPFKPIDVSTSASLALNNFRHINILSNQYNAPEVRDDTPYQIKKVVNFINDNIHEKIKIEDLVAQTRWKKNYFILMFSKYMRCTPHQYILKCKVEKCLVLLNTTNLSANDISYELGFNSYSNFSKLFKKVTGMTIEEYKLKDKVLKFKKD